MLTVFGQPVQGDKPTSRCPHCHRDVPLRFTHEVKGSLKIERDCPWCYAYEMVRLMPDEAAALKTLHITR